MTDVRVVAWFKDGKRYEVSIPRVMSAHLSGPAEAITKAKEIIGETNLREMEKRGIVQWEVEEDFV